MENVKEKTNSCVKTIEIVNRGQLNLQQPVTNLHSGTEKQNCDFFGVLLNFKTVI